MYHAEYEEYDDMSREEWLEYRQGKKLEKRNLMHKIMRTWYSCLWIASKKNTQ